MPSDTEQRSPSLSPSPQEEDAESPPVDTSTLSKEEVDGQNSGPSNVDLKETDAPTSKAAESNATNGVEEPHPAEASKDEEGAEEHRSPTEPSETLDETEAGAASSEAPEAQTANGADPSNDSTSTTTPAEPSDALVSATAPAQTEWQAIWAPAYNAYYFFNSKTGVTTWTNPLQQAPAESSTSSQALDAAYGAQYAEVPEHLEGIDPLLRHLDPTAPTSGPGGAYAASARFNRHTGRFEADPTRNPERMSEFERAKRMSEVYFDVAEWEKEVEARKEQERQEGGTKRKRPSQKDLERFAEQKKRKKIAKTAWLRN